MSLRPSYEELEQRVAELAKAAEENNIAKALLRQKEEEFRTLFENLNVGVYRNTGGSQGRFIKANPAIARIFGFDSVEEFMEVSVADLYLEAEDRQQFVKEVLENGYIHERELRLKKKDSTFFWGACSASIKYGPGGEIEWLDGIIEDITERKLIQEKLHLSEAEYRTLFENLNVGVYRNTGGSQGRFIKANPAIAKIFGFDSVEEFMEVSVADLYLEAEDRQQFVKEVLENGYIHEKELRLKKKDGTFFWGACSASIKYGPGGEIEWIDGIIEDISARKEAQEMLRKTNEILNNILSSSPVGIGLVEGSLVKWANKEMIEMFGFENEGDYSDQQLEKLYSTKEEYDRVMQAINTRLKTGKSPRVDAEYKRKGGDTFVGHFKMSCPDPANPLKRSIFTIQDISWRMQAEAERLQREKIQAVLETAGAVCHELNQPLQSIAGYSEIIIRTTDQQEPGYQKLEKIKTQVDRLGVITQKLQNITKYETKDYAGGAKIIDIDKAGT